MWHERCRPFPPQVSKIRGLIPGPRLPNYAAAWPRDPTGEKTCSMSDAIPDDVLKLMAEKFRALGEPTRLAIVRALMTGGEQNVGQLVEATKHTHANVSKHLKQLSKAGMLGRRKEGLQVFYRLTDPVVEKLCRLVCDSIVDDVKGQLRGNENDVV
jgi:DNA-binding transcriptional ArsR family regulator